MNADPYPDQGARKPTKITSFMIYYLRVYFPNKNSTFRDGIRILYGLALWIPIRTEVKSGIRICIETNVDPEQCGKI